METKNYFTPEQLSNINETPSNFVENLKPYIRVNELESELKEAKAANSALQVSYDKLLYDFQDVPLCASHAETWFCDRNLIKDDCWMCAVAERYENKFKELRRVLEPLLTDANFPPLTNAGQMAKKAMEMVTQKRQTFTVTCTHGDSSDPINVIDTVVFHKVLDNYAPLA